MSPHRIRVAILAGWSAAAVSLCSCVSIHRAEDDGPPGPDPFPVVEGAAAHHAADTVHKLAHALDHLEHHIDKFGSVVAKQPDVWGQARLTKYRQEYENVMVREKDNFVPTIQGRTAQDDQAFFTYAQALSVAAGSSAPLLRPVRPNTIIYNSSGDTELINTTGVAPGTRVFQQIDAPTAGDPPAFPPLIAPVGAETATQTRSFENSRINAGGPLFNPAATVGATETNNLISLEPTERLLQKNRYLDLLHQLRRNSEGDDTSDAPGYSLNLVRIPVSVLPGKRTDTGFGAEVTVSMTPVLGDDLLPTTFRNLVANDVVDQISLPLTQILNDPAVLCRACEQPPASDDPLPDRCAPPEGCPVPVGGPMVLPLTPLGPAPAPAAPKPATPKLPEPKAAAPKLPALKAVEPRSFKAQRLQARDDVAKNLLPKLSQQPSFPVPATRNRRARYAFPPSQSYDVYGEQYAVLIGTDVFFALQKEMCARGYAHLPDVQGFLAEEVKAAYRFLAQPGNEELWACVGPELATAIQAQDYTKVSLARQKYGLAVRSRTTDGCATLTEALGWAVLVEAALLSEHLARDVRESATARGAPAAPVVYLDFHLPHPSPEARQTFNDYVRTRWPIHVFALDPGIDEQNIADSYTRRRETQLALAVAFTGGQISSRRMMQFARRLDAEFDTIAINRTAVGFSHGDQTFGWRFYPRFQTPPADGNFRVLFRDLFVGGPTREADLRDRKLEPGPRECVAVVIMPSFVPYVTCDVAANWFGLANPKRKVMETTDAVRLSRAVQTIQTRPPAVADAARYRPGEVERLARKADQLAARLPLQTLQVQVPYENTLGGFEMFSTGITDLAPELAGWYGAPGVDLDSATTLFLYGNHFSVHQTQVIVGNKPCPHQLLSRQVMQVVVPRGTLSRSKDGVTTGVEVTVATPYGVTAPMTIPQVSTAAGQAGGGGAVVGAYSFGPGAELEGIYTVDGGTVTLTSLRTTDGRAVTVRESEPLNPLAPGLLYLRFSGRLTETGGPDTQLPEFPSAGQQLDFSGGAAVVPPDPFRANLAAVLKNQQKLLDRRTVTIRLTGALSFKKDAEFRGQTQLTNELTIRLSPPLPLPRD